MEVKYTTFAQQQAARTSASAGTGGKLGPEVHFLNELLTHDGDVAIVRFPYTSMADISIETTHIVEWTGSKYGKRVRCEGVGKCPLCEAGNKISNRFFVKALAYVTDPTTKTVKILNTVWDRPSAFADIDIKDLMDEANNDFGTTLDNLLVKIKRSGEKTETRYTLSLSLNNNKAIYNPDVYKADFTELNQVDAARILSKTYAQYQAMLHPDTDDASPIDSAPTDRDVSEKVAEDVPYTPHATTATTYEAPKAEIPAVANSAVRKKTYF